MKTILLLAAVVLFILPSAALADTLTFNSPVTAANNNAATQGTGNSNYNGGTGQFDLDHHNAYTWQINNINLPAGQTITSATICFKNIANWDTTTNKLFVHLFNSASAPNTGNNVIGVVGDASGAPVTVISDYFASANTLAPSGLPNDTFLFEQAFNMVGQGGYVATDFVYTFNAAQLSALGSYIGAGNNIAFGFDPDCHYWNNGIVFKINTSPSTVPEPATLALLGTGLMSAGFYLRRRRQTKANTQK